MPTLNLTWYMETQGSQGFEFGLDTVTPIDWALRHSRKISKEYRSMGLPDPKKSQDQYSAWLKANRNGTIFGSVLDLRKMIQSLMESQNEI